LLDANLLLELARNLPQLSRLTLHGTFLMNTLVTPAQFGIFGELLQQPLRQLHLGQVCWLTSAHLDAFLCHQGRNLRTLELLCCGVYYSDTHQFKRLDDSQLNAISRYCHGLEKCTLRQSSITTVGLGTFLRANRSLRELNVVGCDKLGPETIDLLIKHAPALQTLRARPCAFLTDQGILRWVVSRIESSNDNFVPLNFLSVRTSSVTPAGLRQILSLAPRVLRTIEIHDPRIQLQEDEVKWRRLIVDFPDVKFDFTEDE
jgi:hypothetical protein